MGSGGVGEGQWSRSRPIVVLVVEATQHLMRTMFIPVRTPTQGRHVSSSAEQDFHVGKKSPATSQRGSHCIWSFHTTPPLHAQITISIPAIRQILLAQGRPRAQEAEEELLAQGRPRAQEEDETPTKEKSRARSVALKQSADVAASIAQTAKSISLQHGLPRGPAHRLPRHRSTRASLTDVSTRASLLTDVMDKLQATFVLRAMADAMDIIHLETAPENLVLRGVNWIRLDQARRSVEISLESLLGLAKLVRGRTGENRPAEEVGGRRICSYVYVVLLVSYCRSSMSVLV